MHVIEITNAELMETITHRAKEMGITNGAIVSLIGGADSFTISTMPASDATADVITDYDVPAEMHGAGEIRDGRGARPRHHGGGGGPRRGGTSAPGADRNLVRQGLRPAAVRPGALR